MQITLIGFSAPIACLHCWWIQSQLACCSCVHRTGLLAANFHTSQWSWLSHACHFRHLTLSTWCALGFIFTTQMSYAHIHMCANRRDVSELKMSICPWQSTVCTRLFHFVNALQKVNIIQWICLKQHSENAAIFVWILQVFANGLFFNTLFFKIFT
jgi:hypothetical protein